MKDDEYQNMKKKRKIKKIVDPKAGVCEIQRI